MKRLLLILAVYVLASFAMQAQVINPNGLKEMWVNDSISGNIYVSPDSTIYYHLYYNQFDKKLKLYKRDLLTNHVLIENEIYYAEFQEEMPEMDVSSDGQYIVILPKYLYVDSIYVYSQQDLELIKKIPLNLEEILEDVYDKERFEVQGVKVTLVENPIFITNDNKLIFNGRYEGYSQIPIGERIKGDFQCIYNIETGICINEFHATRNFFPNIRNYEISPSKSKVLMTINLNEKNEQKFILIDIDKLLDFIEKENVLKGYHVIANEYVSNYCINLEENYIYWVYPYEINVYDLKNNTLIVDNNTNHNVVNKPAMINKKYLTITSLDSNTHQNPKIELLDINSKRFYTLYNNKFSYFKNYYIKKSNILIFEHGSSPFYPNEIIAYKLDVETIVDVNDEGENEIIYPNPASDYIEISINKPSEGLEPSEGSNIEIYDVLGNRVISVETRHALSLQRIDISFLQRGVYFMKIGDRVEKFIKL